MRNLLNNISTIGKFNIGRGITMLVVCGEVVRTLSARSLAALAWCASWMSDDMPGALRQGMIGIFGTSVAMHTVPCRATVQQPVRQRQVVRYRSIG
jgi:hypothetical protein